MSGVTLQRNDAIGIARQECAGAPVVISVDTYHQGQHLQLQIAVPFKQWAAFIKLDQALSVEVKIAVGDA